MSKKRRCGGGPRTDEGKQRAAMNATKHGLRGANNLLPTESAEQFNAFSESIMAVLCPADALQGFWAERIVGLMWRLRRAGDVEAGAVAGYLRTEMPKRTVLEMCRARTAGEDPKELVPVPAGEAVAGVEAVNELFSKLTRYESGLQRNLVSAMFALREIQATGKGQRPIRTVEADWRE